METQAAELATLEAQATLRVLEQDLIYAEEDAMMRDLRQMGPSPEVDARVAQLQQQIAEIRTALGED